MKNFKKIIFLIVLLGVGANHIFSQKGTESKNHGYFNLTRGSIHNVHRADEDYFEPGVGSFSNSVVESNSIAFGIENINGWFISPYFSAGIGVGYNYYHSPDFNTFPVYLDLRAYFSESRNSFYANFEIGTLLRFDKDYTRGQVVNLGIGYKLVISKQLDMLIGITTNSKMFNLSGFSNPDPIHGFTINSVSLDLGILF